MTRLSLEERFVTKFEIEDETGHWLWTAHRLPLGYGQFWNGERLMLAHRFAYELWIGPIPDGLQIDHLCKTPPCINPEHLEVVTPEENVRRGRNVNRDLTHCLRGHPFDVYGFFYPSRPTHRQCRLCYELNQEKYRTARPRGACVDCGRSIKIKSTRCQPCNNRTPERRADASRGSREWWEKEKEGAS